MLLLGLSTGQTVAIDPPPDVTDQVQTLLAEADLPWAVHDVSFSAQTLAVCLDVPLETLCTDDGLGAETVQAAVQRALVPLDWRVLHVQARDQETGACRALSSFLHRAVTHVSASTRIPAVDSAATRPAFSFSRSLVGKTIYVSAGHGWQWSYGSEAWRPQRGVNEGIIEDHNNAEAVGQYLIPYLESAGATVIPVRERDWNTARVIVDNDQGAPGYVETGVWVTSVLTGYAGGTYRFASTVAGTPTATASWQIAVPQQGTYALYAWVYPGWNRAPDARYTVSHAGGTKHVWLDQRIRQQTWRYLGTFPFYAGTATVTLDNASAGGSGAVVIADALRLGGGSFDSLDGIVTDATFPPQRPWWETATFYYSQWMGLNYDDWEGFNDVTARPMFARWNHAGSGEDALYISWHTNGYTGTTRGTESYIHNGDTYSRTLGSPELQTAVHTELLHDIRVGWDAAWVDRGQRQADLGELRMLWDDDPATRMPGVLLEIAFHDNPEDAQALKDPRFNQLAARAVYQGIVRYFEQRDAVDLITLPEPPTHLRVQNLGGGAVRVAWQPSPTDGAGLRGEAATGYRIYTSPDGFAWGAPVAVAGTAHTLTGLAVGQTLYVRVTATNDGGESLPTEVLGARVGDHPLVLIVNGFDRLHADEIVIQYDPVEGPNARLWVDQMNSQDYVVHHGEAVPAIYAWDSSSNEAVRDGLVSLQDTLLVDWLLGEEATLEDGTLDAAERAALLAFLNSGRALLISGSYLAWDLDGMGRAPTFMHNVLRAGYVVSDAETSTFQSVVDGAFDGLGAFTFDAPDVYLVDAPDALTPLNGATAALSYAGGVGGTAAIQYVDGCQRLLVLGFPLEAVPQPSRGALMTHTLDYLSACLMPDTTIATPQASGAYSVTPAFTGSAFAWGLTGVSVQVQRGDAEDAFWTGTSWGVPTWLTATGTSSWSYPLPTLTEEGDYTVTARAESIREGSAWLDPTPAQVTFTYDVTPPLTPTLITPTGGVFLRMPLLVFQWTAPEDDGSALAYRLEIVAHAGAAVRVYDVPTTTYAATLPTGVYTWRVRAIDAAGNAGPWSDVALFEVEVEQIFLPSVMRQYEK
ncbi:MAG: N-acetylmuramoyl-L-alanine amidase [Anaerolineae bacterium]